MRCVDDVVCVIPARDEAATIAAVARAALEVVATVVVVDDGSRDGTTQALGSLPVTVLRHDRSRGKGAALALGMDWALARDARAIVTLDGDAQHDPADIPRLVAAMHAHPHAIIIAARVAGREHAPRLRRFANRFADFWLSWAAGQHVADSQSGFRLYPAGLLRELLPCIDLRHGFVFESETLVEAARRGWCVRHVETASLYPADRRPSHYRPIRDTLPIVRMVAGRLIERRMYLQGLARALAGSKVAMVPMTSTKETR